MEPNEIRMIALVNRLTDAFYPNPDDPGPVGPWGPWIREALKEGPLPEPWGWRVAALAELAGLAGQVDNHDNPFGGRRPRPNWALLSDLASLNPQPLPPVASGIGFARSLANVVDRRAREAGSEQGGNLLRRFAEDVCGNVPLFPKIPPKSGDEPRPPRPEELVVLGAALVRAASSIEVGSLRKATEEAGRRIFEQGLSMA